MFLKKIIFIYIFLININTIFISCSKELIELKLDLVKCGSLRNEEYDYYILSLPDQFDKDNHLIIELEPIPQLDLINNIISDPNLYISTTEKNPSIDKYTFKSEHFGDETISINPKNLSQKETFYISVHCKLKCNYILKAQLVKDIPLKTNDLNVFSINPKTVTKLSFKTMSKNFNELYINIIGTYINSSKYIYTKKILLHQIH